MNDKENPNQDNKETTVAILENHKLTDEEKAALLEKVLKNYKGNWVTMTEEELDEFYDTRGF